MNLSPAIEFKNVSKSFGNLKANDSLSFKIRRGDFHGLAGENGAGKSTAMNLFYGLHSADSGEIWLDGKPVSFRTPQQAIAAGIGMVHQHFMLVPTLSVWENIILGWEPRSFFLNKTFVFQKLEALQKTFGFNLNLSAPVEGLSLGEQQQVEILKLLYRNADILILDEPTAVLTPLEVTSLFEKLRALQEQGKTVIVITHKLKEILKYTYSVTVMRGGKVITTQKTSELSEETLSELIMGRPKTPVPSRFGYQGLRSPVLHLDSVSTESEDSPNLNNLNLSVPSGQIVGIAGIEGQGQKALVNALCQITPHSGSIVLFGESLEASSAYSKRQKGFSVIPLDRQNEGLVMDFTNADNCLLGHQNEASFKKHRLLNGALISAFSQRLMDQFKVRPANPSLASKHLSGGNQQKLLIARETFSETRFLLACHPTRGVDIGAMEFIHSHFLKLADEGAGILLISSDLDELFALTDTLVVMREGKFVFTCPTSEISLTELGLWMTGAKT